MSARSQDSSKYEPGNLEAEPLANTSQDDDVIEYNGVVLKASSAWSKRFSGWRGGVLIAILIASLVLLLNVVFLIVASTVWTRENGFVTAFTGDCGKARRTTTALHLLINLLSSLLLGASNYCMQRLAAPTRKEVNNAHAKKKWLDIGVPSIRNLLYISKWRTLLWVLLAVSSVPLHFVYNSVVFETIAANDVGFAVVSPAFFTDPNSWHRINETVSPSFNAKHAELQNLVLDNKYLDRTLFDNLTDSQCRGRYGASFITGGGTGFGVPTPWFFEQWQQISNDSFIDSSSGSGELAIRPSRSLSQKSTGEAYYSYCLSQKLPQKCQVQFSLTLLIVVIVSNAIKLLLMVSILWRLNDETLVTIGDAVSSFMKDPDSTTTDCCLMSRNTVGKLWRYPDFRMNQRWLQSGRAKWWTACTLRRWTISLFLYCGTLIAAGVLLSQAQSSGDTIRAGPNGFGKVNADRLIDVRLPYSDSITSYVLLANLPQTVISFLYFTYNGLFTCMLATREWARFAVKRAPLRVTIPLPGQRSTHFLHLPYVYSVPLLIASILLHWFVSQSIFLARIALYEGGKPAPDGGFDRRLSAYQHFSVSGNILTGIGYSDAALVASMCWGAGLIAACMIVATWMKYPMGLPKGGTNSAVISAACHFRYEDESGHKFRDDMVREPIKWGVTIRGGRHSVGHCCFSSEEVERPEFDCLYAGQPFRRKEKML